MATQPTPESASSVAWDDPFAQLSRPGMDALNVGFIDDHPVILSGLVHALRVAMPQLGTTLTSDTVDGLLSRGEVLDAVVLDVRLGDGSVPENNVADLAAHGYRPLLFTQETRPHVIARCLRAGAWGIVGKHEPIAVLAEAVTTVASGTPHLNPEWALAIEADAGWRAPDLAPREREALCLYAAGLPLKSVARQMGISPDTVREYLLRVRSKYGDIGRPAHTRTELYTRAVEDSLIEAPHVH